MCDDFCVSRHFSFSVIALYSADDGERITAHIDRPTGSAVKKNNIKSWAKTIIIPFFKY